MSINTNISANINKNSQKLEEVTSFKYLVATPWQGWHMPSRNPHYDGLSNDSNG